MILKEDIKEYERMLGLDEIVNKDIFYLIKSGLYRIIDGVDLEMTRLHLQYIRYEDIDKSDITSEDLEGFREYLYGKTMDRLIEINQDLKDGGREFRECSGQESYIGYELYNYMVVATYVLGYQRGVGFNEYWSLKEECILELEQGVDNTIRDRNGHFNMYLKRQLEKYRVKGGDVKCVQKVNKKKLKHFMSL